jgi:hypothetical protein
MSLQKTPKYALTTSHILRNTCLRPTYFAPWERKFSLCEAKEILQAYIFGR